MAETHDDELTHERLRELFEWIDSIPLSRPKRNIARDFADGVLMAEVVKHYYPRNVDLHNYTKSSSLQQKISNWETLNHKVFRKMNFVIHHEDIDDVVNARRNAIERVLLYVRKQMALYESQEVGNMVSTPTSTPSRPASTVLKRNIPVAVASAPPQPQPSAVQPETSAPHIEQINPTPQNPSLARGSVRGPAGVPSRSAVSPRGPSATRSTSAAKTSMSMAQSPNPVSRNTPTNIRSQPSKDPESEMDASQPQTDSSIIEELRNTVELLQQKVVRLEQLVQLKSKKITSLTQKLEAAGLT